MRALYFIWLQTWISLRSSGYSVVIPREGGESGTPRPLGYNSGLWILGHPPQCAIAHKAGDDDPS